MKIGVNARFLNQPYTGIGQYTRFLFDELSKIDHENEYALIKPKKTGSFLAGFKKTYWEQFALPNIFEKKNIDIVHSPYPCNPWSRSKTPQIITIHDTIPWDMPEYRGSFLSKLYHSKTKKAAKKATLIITVSNSSKKDIIRNLHVDPDKIKVIYNAASPVFSHRNPDSKDILHKHNLKNPYLLYVGGYDDRKNVKLLLEIYNKYISPNHKVDLVMVGGKLHNQDLYGSFDSLTENPDHSTIKLRKGGVKSLGFLPDEELAAIYQNCLCFCHLSKKEGFNIPIVEAIESAVPVIVSDTEVHREIAKEAAEFVDLENIGHIAKTLEKVITDEDYREKLVAKSKSLKGHYTWRKSAEEHLKIYHAIDLARNTD
jgi:glycosyltransferase involved in cell wall biosynthesis